MLAHKDVTIINTGFSINKMEIDRTKLLRILKTIPEGEIIAGINIKTKYKFITIEEYNSHGKAPDLDGAPIVILESDKRKRSKIKLFVFVLVYFLKDGVSHLSHGQLPPSYVAGSGFYNLILYHFNTLCHKLKTSPLF